MTLEISNERLRSYCRMIATALSNTLNMLSDTGVPIAFNARQKQQFSGTFFERSAKFDHPDGDIGKREKEERFDGDLPARLRGETEDDLDYLGVWAAKTERKPLLVQAPFGFGKSALLAAFAVDLANTALKVLADPDVTSNHPALRIPLPVRLRGFKPEEANGKRWSDLLAGAFEQYASGAMPNQQLTPDEIRILNGSGQLICLYDGHDEVGEASAKDILHDISSFHFEHKGYILSSREHPDGFDEDRICRLQELSDRSIQSLLGVVLKGQPDKLKIAKERFEALEPAISLILRRPLFLAIWAQKALTCERPTDLPCAVDELMTLVTLQCFRRASKVLGSKCPPESEWIKTFSSLGYFLFADAETSFEELPRGVGERYHIINQCFRECISIVAATEYEVEKTRELAEALGLLSIRETGECWSLKIPVVEYLVGRFLGDLACGTKPQQRAFVEVIRRWCYRPRTHDTLDYAMYRIKRNDDERQMSDGVMLIEQLGQWMREVSDHEPYRRSVENRVVEIPVGDCVVRPAVWHALRMADRLSLPMIDAIAHAAVAEVILGRAPERTTRLMPPANSVRTFIAVLKAVISYHAAAKWPKQDFWLGPTICLVRTCLEEKDASTVRQELSNWCAEACDSVKSSADVVLKKITSYADQRSVRKHTWTREVAIAPDAFVIGPNEDAIKEAAGCLDGKEVAKIVRGLIGACLAAQNSEKENLDATSRAIFDSAYRVTENDAGSLVHELISSFFAAAPNSDRGCWEWAWTPAIHGAAKRVARKDAANVLLAMISCYDVVCVEAQDSWLWAIADVAGRVINKDVTATVNTLIGRWAKARSGARGVWAHAILRAARRAKTLVVVEQVTRAFAECDKWRDLAVTVAVDSVALLAEVVSEHHANRNATGNFVWTGKLIPMQRDDRRLVLDPHLTVAPESIAKLLRETRVDSNPMLEDPSPVDVGPSARGEKLVGTIDLLLVEDRIYLDGVEMRKIGPKAMIVLRKLMQEPRRRWKFHELLSPPENKNYNLKNPVDRKDYKEYVRTAVNSLPGPVRSLLEESRGGHHAGRRFQEHVKPRFK